MWLSLPGRIFELCIDTDNYYSTIYKLIFQNLPAPVHYQTCFQSKVNCNNKSKHSFIALFYFDLVIYKENKA